MKFKDDTEKLAAALRALRSIRNLSDKGSLVYEIAAEIIGRSRKRNPPKPKQ